MSNISGIHQNINIRIDGNVQTETAEQGPVTVKNGDTIKGTIMSVSDTDQGKLISINIGENVISARLSEEMGLRQGQALSFVVRGTGANGITISPLFENTSVDQSTLKALNAAGLEITNDNIQLVKEMMEAHLPIDKATLQEMSAKLNLFPNSSITAMVEMKSLGIPITENNLEQFTNYKNYEHQVINDMNEIINELPKAFDNLVSVGNNNGAINLYGSLLQLFSENTTVVENGTLSNDASLQVQGETMPAGDVAALATEGEENIENLSSGADGRNIKQAETENSAAQLNPGLSENAEKVKNIFSESFLDNLRNLNASEKAIEDLNKGNSQTLFKELSASFDGADLSNNVEMVAWKKLFSSDEYNKLLKENISSQWFLDPSKVEKKENVDNLYQRLGTQAKALAESITNSLGAESKLGQAANNLNNNLDFMNQLNQMFQYVQLPLQMTGQNVHGDLYVYKNKHKKMSEDGSVSAVLHLDMESLGPVDVYVKLLESKVSTNFYVADDSILDLINDNIHILNERLEKRGYSMQAKLMLHEDIDGQDAAIDEMLDVKKRPLLSTASFDARA